MAEENKRTTKTCSYSLDQDTLDRLQAIHKLRKMQGGRFSGRYHAKSTIVRDAVCLLYNFQVLGKSIVHPREKLRKENYGRSSEKEQNKLK